MLKFPVFSNYEWKRNVEKQLVEFLTTTLDDLKAQDILAIDVVVNQVSLIR